MRKIGVLVSPTFPYVYSPQETAGFSYVGGDDKF